MALKNEMRKIGGGGKAERNITKERGKIMIARTGKGKISAKGERGMKAKKE